MSDIPDIVELEVDIDTVHCTITVHINSPTQSVSLGLQVSEAQALSALLGDAAANLLLRNLPMTSEMTH